MATDRGRGRRGFHFHKAETQGSLHPVQNEAVLRYTRDQLLRLYTDADPSVETTDYGSEVYLLEPLKPASLLEASFTHSLGEDVNAFERHTKAPEWATGHQKDKNHEHKENSPLHDPKSPQHDSLLPSTEPSNQPSETHLKEEVFEEHFGDIDREIERKLQVEEEKGEPLPEWAETPSKPIQPPAPQRPAAKFSSHLLQVQMKKGDPFAKVILDNGTNDQQGFTYVSQESKPLEKVWYYRDPQNQVQGPFSTVEMYNWNLVGYFPTDLPVAWSSPDVFIALAQLLTLETYDTPQTSDQATKEGESPEHQKPSEPKEVPANEEKNAEFSLFSYHPDPGVSKKPAQVSTVEESKTVWGPKQKPATKSLLEIQREEIETGNRKQ